ncbi:MAG: hypothetical protein M3P47_01175 [Pseudomonadota bacterium]|nr:hypothetical protein [Pseudomonadota bacterium]
MKRLWQLINARSISELICGYPPIGDTASSGVHDVLPGSGIFFGCVPVNLVGQFVQRATLIQHLIQPQPEPVILGILLDLRGLILQGIRTRQIGFLQIQHPLNTL